MTVPLLKIPLGMAGVAAGLYACLLGALMTPFFQSHAVYLHAFQMTGSKDLNIPEMFGFLRGQVTPFWLTSKDDGQLHAWHVLPIELYRKHEISLAQQPQGPVDNMTSTLAFELLRNDPEARLVIYFHGDGGNVGSGYRVPCYKALAAGQPEKMHVLTFDYRGFGLSPGEPSEEDIIQDAQTIVDWALDVAQIPPSRIIFFGQSLGTAVNIAMAEHYASLETPITFAGHLLIAPFVDVTTLVATYRLAGTIPLLSPFAKYPALLDWLQSYVRDQWPSSDRISRYVRSMESRGNRYRITILHAEDDYDIPWHHTPTLFWHAVNATSADGLGKDSLEQQKQQSRQDYGAAGSVFQWRTEHGTIIERILKYGLHDVIIMGNPIVTLAAMNMFDEEGQCD